MSFLAQRFQKAGAAFAQARFGLCPGQPGCIRLALRCGRISQCGAKPKKENAMPAHRLAFSQSAARWLLNGLLSGLLASLAAGACAAPALSAEPAECTAIDESALEQAYAQWSREAAQALREHAKALAAPLFLQRNPISKKIPRISSPQAAINCIP